MRKLFFLLALLAFFPGWVLAQDDVSAVEVFGGYSYLRTGSGYDQNSHGWNTSVAVNLADHFAIKGDVAGHYDSTTFGNAKINSQLYTFLFGPQVNFRSTEQVNPFLHALFGVGRDITKYNIAGNRASYGNTGFAMAVGGGLDYKINDNLSWRLFQADYLLTRYRDPLLVPQRKRNINHFRLSTGLVIH